MFPSLLSNLLWGAPKESEAEQIQREEVNHTAQEEAGDWLLISCPNSCGKLRRFIPKLRIVQAIPQVDWANN